MVECTPINCLIGPWPLSSLAYDMITHTPLVAGNLPIKTLVAMAMANKCNCKDIHDNQTLHGCRISCERGLRMRLHIHCVRVCTAASACCLCSGWSAPMTSKQVVDTIYSILNLEFTCGLYWQSILTIFTQLAHAKFYDEETDNISLHTSTHDKLVWGCSSQQQLQCRQSMHGLAIVWRNIHTS